MSKRVLTNQIVTSAVELLEAKYKKEGRKEKQPEFVPQLQEEIREARKGINIEIMYEDQNGPEYEAHLIEVHEKLCHKDFSKSRRLSILKIMHKFALCF